MKWVKQETQTFSLSDVFISVMVIPVMMNGSSADQAAVLKSRAPDGRIITRDHQAVCFLTVSDPSAKKHDPSGCAKCT